MKPLHNVVPHAAPKDWRPGVTRNPHPDPRDWKYTVSAAQVAASPPALSWFNAYNYSAKNQNGYGDCVGMGTADAMQGWATINGYAAPALSGAACYSEACNLRGQHPPLNNGSTVWDGLTAAHNTGVPLDSFNHNPLTDLSAAELADAPNHKITGYSNLFYGGVPGVRDLIKAAIAARHSLVCAFNCTNTFHGTGTQPWPLDGSSFIGGHEVALLGYDQDWLYAIGSWGYLLQRLAWGFVESWDFFDCYAIISCNFVGIPQGALPDPLIPVVKATPVINLSASLSGGNAPTGLISVTATYAGDANNNAVTLTQQFAPDGSVPPAPALANGSFEALSVHGGYAYVPNDPSWKFAGNAGLCGNGSAFGAPTSPDGVQSAFIQSGNPSTPPGSVTQTIALAAGAHTLTLKAARRNVQVHPVTVSMDGQTIGTLNPSSGTSWDSVSFPFTVSAGNHTLAFAGTVTSGDVTTFIDNVVIS